jgi:uncharacterized protein
MARYPAVGEVKTRLAAELGAERAYRLYRAFLLDIETRFASQRRALLWAFYPPDRDFASILRPGAHCLPQEGANLGERMLHCFRQVAGAGFERILMMGADVPHVRNEWLDDAEARLGDRDLVLGPSRDGGYYLIAMRTPCDVFSGIEMSTAHVLSETIAKAAAARITVHLLPESFDVDEPADVERLWDVLTREGMGDRLPATAALLRQWRR